jgi:hypothetical protein
MVVLTAGLAGRAQVASPTVAVTPVAYHVGDDDQRASATFLGARAAQPSSSAITSSHGS